MIYELRSYRVAAGRLDEYETVFGSSLDIRRGEYGTFEGAWRAAECGQFVHLWSYDDLRHRDACRDRLRGNARWNDDFIPRSVALLVSRESRILLPARPLRRPATRGNRYALTTTQLRVGTMRGWLATCGDDVVGLWYMDIGSLDEAIALSIAPSVARRDTAGAVVREDVVVLEPWPGSPLG